MKHETCRILIADDEPIERAVISKTIKNYFGEEVEIYQAVNGREAIEIFRSKDCQVALLDISMPGINGLEAAEEIRRGNSVCSIIFLTAYDEFDYAKRAIRVQALDYLLKPSAKEELITVLEEAVHLAGIKERKAKERPEVYIVVTFGLGYRARSPRIDAAVEPYPGRFTHHVLVSGTGEVDDELMGWVKEAAVFSAGKR